MHFRGHTLPRLDVFGSSSPELQQCVFVSLPEFDVYSSIIKYSHYLYYKITKNEYFYE